MSVQAIKFPKNPNVKRLASTWFVVTFIGQAIFAIYIMLLYGGNAVMGDFEKWNSATPQGHVEGDPIGNIIFGVHIAMAAIVTIGGPLQLMPIIRKRTPKFHRWNGRVYAISGLIISVAGLYLTWIKGSVGGMIGNVFVTINALVILVSIFFAVKFAKAKKFKLHNQWALRLFIGMSGVWLFRVYLMFWVGINQGPVGFDPEEFQGPALTAIYFGCYVLPLIILQGFFNAQEKPTLIKNRITILILSFLILSTFIGICVATIGMWLPNM